MFYDSFADVHVIGLNKAILMTLKETEYGCSKMEEGVKPKTPPEVKKSLFLSPKTLLFCHKILLECQMNLETVPCIHAPNKHLFSKKKRFIFFVCLLFATDGKHSVPSSNDNKQHLLFVYLLHLYKTYCALKIGFVRLSKKIPEHFFFFLFFIFIFYPYPFLNCLSFSGKVQYLHLWWGMFPARWAAAEKA